MPQYKYLIAGGGMTADAAVKGIRKIDHDGSIGIIASETVPPYKRPPLTKGLWKGKPEDSIWLNTEDAGVDLRLGREALRIDPETKQVVDNKNEVCSYEKLLIATGGTPRTLEDFPEADIIYYRTFDDYRGLRTLVNVGDDFAVIGAGFIGTEIAAALAMNGKNVTMIFPDEVIGQKLYPKELTEFLTLYYEKKGVRLINKDGIVWVEKRGDKSFIITKEGHEIEVDGVVAGIGIEPNINLAKTAGLDLQDGVDVDEFLRTKYPDIYAAGDVANFYNPLLEKRIRVEHVDNATHMGQCAGKIMAGAGEPYHYLPFFYSDLFDLGYEAIGEIDSRLETIADWKTEFEEGIIYYMRNSCVCGVLLWNYWDKVDEARDLIAEKRTYTAADLQGLL